jgi:hypothetical protein
MIALILAAVAAVVFGIVSGNWEAAIGVGIAYTLAGLVWLEVSWRSR